MVGLFGLLLTLIYVDRGQYVTFLYQRFFTFFPASADFAGVYGWSGGISGRSFPGKCGFCGCVWLIRGVSGRSFPGECGFCGCVWLIRGVSGRYFPGECVSFCVFGGSGIVLRGSVGGKYRQSFRCAKIFVSFLCRDFVTSVFTMGELQAWHFLVHNAILDFQKGKDTEYQLEGHTISTRFD